MQNVIQSITKHTKVVFIKQNKQKEMKKAIFIFAFFIGATGVLSAQTSNFLYHSYRIPQANQQNPAFFPTNNQFYISLPANNLQFGFPFAVSDLLRQGTSNEYDTLGNLTNVKDVLVIDMNKITDILNDNARSYMGLDMNLLGFGFRVKQLFFTASAGVRTHLSIGFPSGFSKLLTEGLGNDQNTTISFADGNLLQAQAYAEAALGVGYKIGPWTAGLRLKVLDGIADLSTINTNISVTSTPDMSALTGNLYYQLRGSYPDTLTAAAFTSNWGVGVDLGASFELGKFKFSASILDLGKINWKANTHKITPEGSDSSFTFTGIDLNNVISNGQVNMDNLVDTAKINALLRYQTTDGEAYATSLPTRFNLGASWSPLDFLTVGALFHGELSNGLFPQKDLKGIRDNIFRNSTALMVNLHVGNWFEFMLANTMVYDGSHTKFINPGFGINIGPQAMQFYFLMDYMSSLSIVSNKQLNFSFGCNILPINKKK